MSGRGAGDGDLVAAALVALRGEGEDLEGDGGAGGVEAEGAGPGVGAGGEDGGEEDLVLRFEHGADVAADLELDDGGIRRGVPGEEGLQGGDVVAAGELDGIGSGAGEGGVELSATCFAGATLESEPPPECEPQSECESPSGRWMCSLAEWQRHTPGSARDAGDSREVRHTELRHKELCHQHRGPLRLSRASR